MTPITSVPAVLRDWRLTFNIPHFFSLEGGTGNIDRSPGDAVHGVVYGCRHADLAALDELEALGVAYQRVEMTVETYAGRQLPAYVYVGLPSKLVHGLQPSRRYLNILIRGAEDMRLDPSYIEWLTKLEVCHRPSYGRFVLPDTPDELFSSELLACRALHTALAGAVFDMSGAREEHRYLQQLFCGRDVTLFLLKRMDSSDGSETWEDVQLGRLSAQQRDYLNDYLHEFSREYRYAGRMDYAPALHAPRPASVPPPSSAPPREIAARRVLRTAEQTHELLGHENLGFLSESHGFMPRVPPLLALPSEFAAWDQAAAELTVLYRTLRVREELDRLPVLDAGPEQLPDKYLLRAAACLAMLAHGYWYVETRPPRALPPGLALPWAELRRRLGRQQQVLTYVDLIVYNWRLIDPDSPDPMRAENMRLLFPTVNNQEERVFYLTQTEILAQTAPVIGAIVRAQEAVVEQAPRALADALVSIIESLQRVVRESLLNINPNPASPTYVDPVVWAKTVAPFAVPFEQGLQGPSGTSSPIFSLFDIFFGRRNHETFLGREIRALRRGYPLFWREFMNAVAEVSVSEFVAKSGDPALSGLLKDAVEVYAGENGFLGRHRMKVYGYLELGFKVGRRVTIGGFSGAFKDRTWDRVDSELEYARMERLETFPTGCHHGRVKQVGQTHPGASENVKHVVLDVSKTGVRYQAGDRCAILPENGKELVERTLAALRARGDERIALTPEWQDAVRLRAGYESVAELSLREVLRFGRIRPVTPRVAEALHAATQNEALLDAILRQTTTRWELWDLLQMLAQAGYDTSRLWSASLDSSENICRIVPPENFRVYSIASVMGTQRRDSASEIHLLVGRVRYHEDTAADPELERRGAASNFLAELAGWNDPVSFMIQHPARFSLPKDPSIPIVMLAGGTGMSPFRSFVLERLRQPNAGDSYLFLALRSREHFYYRDELLHWLSSGKLKLELAFSREDVRVHYESGERPAFRFEPGPRRHIEDVLSNPETAVTLRRLLASKSEGGAGAYVYICGRSPFARTVNETFKKLFATFETGDQAARDRAAVRSVAQMVGEGRYMQEIFTDARSWDVRRREYEISELIEHNDDERGHWLVIDNLVYDMTEFIHMHPGGMRVLAGYSGMDATQGYLRAHSSRSEIDAMREVYEIGAVRRLDFKRVSRVVPRPAGPQTVALSALYRVWVSFAYLVVEMQNALRNDQSLQQQATAYGELPTERTPYKLDRGVETHERFLKNYLEGICGEPATKLWELTQGLSAPDGDAHWLERQLGVVQSSAPAAYMAALGDKLRESLRELVERRADPDDPEYRRVGETVDLFERADRAFLHELKRAIRAGLVLFERHEAETLERAGEGLLDALSALPRILRDYYSELGAACEAGGWNPSLVPTVVRLASEQKKKVVMHTLVSSSYWLMEEDEHKRIVVLRRSAVPVQSIEDLLEQNERVISSIRPGHKLYGIVVDMRQAPARNDPEFENAMRNLRMQLFSHYARLAVLVSSAVGMLQVNRIGRHESAQQLATQDEQTAIKFAMGQ